MGRRVASIDYQVYSAIQEVNLSDDIERRTDIYNDLTNSNEERVGKSEFKREGIAQNYIFSHTAVQNSLTQSKAFANWCKQEFGVRKIGEITPSMARAFLDHKRESGASPATLKTYKFALSKLSSGIERKFNREGFYDASVASYVTGSRSRIERIYSNEQIAQIVSGASTTKFAEAFKVQYALGLRVHELVGLRTEDIGADTVKVTGKGGLVRHIAIQPEHRSLMQEMAQKLSQRVFPGITENGYQKAFHRVTGRLGLEQSYKTHEIRKAYASELLEKLNRENPEGNMRDKYNYVCRQLGHGDDRHDLWRIYLGV